MSARELDPLSWRRRAGKFRRGGAVAFVERHSSRCPDLGVQVEGDDEDVQAIHTGPQLAREGLQIPLRGDVMVVATLF